MNKLTIGWFYPKELNLYGDRGNVEILVVRAKSRGFSAEVLEIDRGTNLSPAYFEKINLVFMGGGPDLAQQNVYKDFLGEKSPYIRDFLEKDGVGLFICGSYQLLGNHYKLANGSVLEGLGFLDFYTDHFGASKTRSIGNIVVSLNRTLLANPYFKNNNYVGNTLVGFENHGGRTYLSEGLDPLGVTHRKYGNNDKDTTEGVLYRNTVGTYLHGPVLARNPHLADFLIAKSVQIPQLEKLDDSVIISAHTQSKELAR